MLSWEEMAHPSRAHRYVRRQQMSANHSTTQDSRGGCEYYNLLWLESFISRGCLETAAVPNTAAAAAKLLQSCPTLCDPIDGSPSGSPIPGILQARTLEWVAISFSNAWKWKVKVKSLSRVRLLVTPWTDCSLPGSSVHGIFQARVLEWGAIAFSGTKYYILVIRWIFIL